MTKPWHRQPKGEMGETISSLVNDFKRDQSGRRRNWVYNLELFEKRKLGGYYAHGYDDAYDDEEVYSLDRLGIVRSAVATAVSQIYAPQKPKPQFQTLGATWAMRRRAYRLDRICEGLLNQRQDRWINVWSLMIDACVDVALQGTAAVKVVADTQRKRIVHKLIPCPDLFVDPAEGRLPQNLFEREPIDEDIARNRWTSDAAKQAIESAQPYEWYGRALAQKPRATKTVELQYAWRLPISEEEPGTWAVCINGLVLERGDWMAPAFPFVFIQYEPHRDGFWASGIADEGRKIAEDAGEVDLRLYYRELLASGKKVYYAKDSVQPEDLEGNDAVEYVPYEGQQPPIESVATPFNPMELEYRTSKVRDFWDAIGISQMSAAARREPGIESGIAQMTLNDTKQGRQLLKSQRYEQAYVDLAHQYVWRLRELAEDEPDFSVTWAGKSLLRTVKWSDAEVEDEMFTVTVAPTSSLPHDPGGRQEMVQTLFKSGLISQDTAKSLIGWPDLDSELSVQNSEFEYVDMLIEKYLDADEKTWDLYDYQAPEGFIINKMQALQRFAAAWFRTRTDQSTLPKAEQLKAEFNMGLLVRYIKELDDLMNPPPPEAPAAPAGAGMAPGAPAGPGAPGMAPDQLPGQAAGGDQLPPPNVMAGRAPSPVQVP